MGIISRAIGRFLTGGAKAFSRYPAAMASALVVAVSASVLTRLDSATDERLFSTLIMAFSGAFFWGMAASVIGDSFRKRRLPFVLLNILAFLGAGGLFAYLYLIRIEREIAVIIVARIIAGALAAYLIFLLTIAADRGRSDYNQSSFMVLKSLMISLLYGLVIMLGLMFVAFTVENLIYEDLSNKVYSYISIWSAFLTSAFFLGYFPSFQRDKTDPRLEITQRHPAFIEILFAFVMIPILLILTVVLLIWAVQILIVGNWQEFELLATIFTAYALIGIFLAVMVSHYDQQLARLFRRIFPIAAIIFLAFEAYAIYRQIIMSGIKDSEYFIILLWIFSLLAALVLLSGRPHVNRLIAVFALIITVLAVLPLTGFQAVPVTSQSARLQNVLLRNDMLVDGRIRTAPPAISLADKITITDAALFLMRDELADVPKAPWLSASLASAPAFGRLFGFEPTYAEFMPDDRTYREIYLYLPASNIDIAGYETSIFSISGFEQPVVINGRRGEYKLSFRNLTGLETPSLLVTRNDETVMNRSFSIWLEGLAAKYDDSFDKSRQPDADDMTLELEQGGVKVMIVFQHVTLHIDSRGQISAFLFPAAVYFAETD